MNTIPSMHEHYGLKVWSHGPASLHYHAESNQWWLIVGAIAASLTGHAVYEFGQSVGWVVEAYPSACWLPRGN